VKNILALTVLWLQFSGLTHAAAETPYRLGILPYMSSRQTVELFGPLAVSLEAALKHPVQLESSASFPDFTRDMHDRRFDIALIQPFDYPDFVDKLGYLPIAQHAIPLVSRIYVRDDSSYRTIDDLRGTIVAMPPAEAANTRMTMRALRDARLLPGRDIEVRNFNSNDSCLQQVWAGLASACGTGPPPAAVFEERMHGKLRAVADAPSIPHILFVAHPRLPAEVRMRLLEHLAGLTATEDGRAILKKIGFQGFIPARPAEYAVMKSYLATAKPVEALAEFMRNPAAFDLVITDEAMPDLSGMDMARVMLKLRPALPVILCTGYSEHATPEAARAAGISGFMTKPLDIGKLVEMAAQFTSTSKEVAA